MAIYSFKKRANLFINKIVCGPLGVIISIKIRYHNYYIRNHIVNIIGDSIMKKLSSKIIENENDELFY